LYYFFEITDLDALKKELEKSAQYGWAGAASVVSTAKPYTLGDEKSPVRIAVLDYWYQTEYSALHGRARGFL